MVGITGACCRLVGELVQALGSGGRRVITMATSIDQPSHHHDQPSDGHRCKQHDDELMIRALTAVFGMESNGKIKKENALRVVEKLGLVANTIEEKDKFELPGGGGSTEDGEEVAAEEVLDGMMDGDGPARQQLLHEAFKIFDEDGNGYIEAVELKRVLQCLGLDKGWDMAQIQHMLMAADLNLDGKVDFSEFELMMAAP